MNYSDGQETITMKKEENTWQVLLLGTQINLWDLSFIENKVNLSPFIEEDFTYQVTYPVSANAKSFQALIQTSQTYLEKLRLTLMLKELFTSVSTYRIPFVHPENILYYDETLTFVHTGIKGSLAPMKRDEDQLLKQYKALVLSALNPTIFFEKLVNGETSIKTPFAQTIALAQDIPTIHEFLQAEWAKENQKEKQTMTKVAKTRYAFFKYAGSAALIGALGMGVVTFITQTTTVPKLEAITQAQSNFITTHYDKTLENLKDYSPTQLPKEARYVLAVSAIQLDNLTASQKSNIL
ncbi:MAG: hypothetical protein LBV67_03300, partial [Streptococcaceae bacterium]|nr:hypothetical protein [Streptococcaceae bacterium]